jgi:hypothetical protein
MVVVCVDDLQIGTAIARYLKLKLNKFIASFNIYVFSLIFLPPRRLKCNLSFPKYIRI